MANEFTTKELVAELRGTSCRCGKNKMSTHTFCSGCFYSLKRAQRNRLYKLIGEGYEDAYIDACVTLGFDEEKLNQHDESQTGL